MLGVEHLFPAAGVRRTTRVGLEHELITRDPRSPGVVSIDRVLTATAGRGYASRVSFEPGGQVELSLPCEAGPARAVQSLLASVAALREDCARAGIAVEATPVDS